MTITATMRRCSACNHLLDGTEETCPNCGRTPAPLIGDWPVGAKRFLCMLIVVDAVATRLHLTEQVQLEWLMENAIRGRWYEGELIPYAASAADCYPKFLDLYRRWQESGAPTDFAAIATLRGIPVPGGRPT